MSGVDITLLALFGIGCFSGYKDGFLLGVFSLLALVLGVLGAFKLMGIAIVYLSDQFDIDEKFLPYVAFAVVFLAIVIAVRLLGNLLKLSIDKTFLGSVDKIAGAALGLCKTIFLLSVLLWITVSMGLELPESWTDHSVILPYIITFAPTLTSWIGEVLPFFRDIFVK